MIIIRQTGSPELRDALLETAGQPRHIWVDGERTLIYTGGDIPIEVQQ